MKKWGPFSDYDFYAYLCAGGLLLGVLDYTFGPKLLLNPSYGWNPVQIGFGVLVAYILGQMIASPAASILEHLVARRLFYPPVAILLGTSRPRLRERFLAAVFCGHYYRPMPSIMRARALAYAALENHANPATFCDPEATFQLAFARARTTTNSSTRVDQFRNLYGFNRNLAFVGMVAIMLLGTRQYLAPSTDVLLCLIAAVVMSVAAFGAFVKFYAAFALEVLRGIAVSPLTRGATPNEDHNLQR